MGASRSSVASCRPCDSLMSSFVLRRHENCVPHQRLQSTLFPISSFKRFTLYVFFSSHLITDNATKFRATSYFKRRSAFPCPILIRMLTFSVAGSTAVHPGFLAFFHRKLETANQWHFRFTTRIGTLNCSGPEPSDDYRLFAIRQFHLGIQMTNPFKCLGPHPFPVISNISGQAQYPRICSVL